MLEIKYLRQNLLTVTEAMTARGHNADLDAFQKWDEDRRTVLQEIETLRHERNVVSDRIAEMKKAGEDAEAIVAEMRMVSSRIKELDKKLSTTQEAIDDFLLGLPNIPHPTVPIGKDEADNPEVKVVGTVPDFKFEPQAHWDIGSRLKILDLDRAARITGARFPLYLGAGARLERALINFMLDTHTAKHGYLEVLPPFMEPRFHDPHRTAAEIRR